MPVQTGQMGAVAVDLPWRRWVRRGLGASGGRRVYRDGEVLPDIFFEREIGWEGWCGLVGVCVCVCVKTTSFDAAFSRHLSSCLSSRYQVQAFCLSPGMVTLICGYLYNRTPPQNPFD